jgi:predicted P-loop ATPase
MAQSIEEIKAGLEAPTHNIVNGEQVDLTAEEIEATLNFWAENERAKQLDEEANGYKVARQSAYASIQDQLDMQYWDNVNGTTTWKDHIAQVKSDNPKPS